MHSPGSHSNGGMLTPLGPAMQTKLRMIRHRKEFTALKTSVIKIQNTFRRTVIKPPNPQRTAPFLRPLCTFAAGVLSLRVYFQVVRKDFVRTQLAAHTAQRMWRGKVGRREFKSVWGECRCVPHHVAIPIRHRLCLVFPLPWRLKHCLCHVILLPSRLSHGYALAAR